MKKINIHSNIKQKKKRNMDSKEDKKFYTNSYYIVFFITIILNIRFFWMAYKVHGPIILADIKPVDCRVIYKETYGRTYDLSNYYMDKCFGIKLYVEFDIPPDDSFYNQAEKIINYVIVDGDYIEEMKFNESDNTCKNKTEVTKIMNLIPVNLTCYYNTRNPNWIFLSKEVKDYLYEDQFKIIILLGINVVMIFISQAICCKKYKNKPNTTHNRHLI